MRLTRKRRGCDDGTCPAIWDTDDPQLVAVQGAISPIPRRGPTSARSPAHEQVVLLPRAILESYARTGRD